MELANSISIQRPQHTVFRFVSDLENAPRWNYAIVETRKVSEGPIGPGTTFRQVRSLPTTTEEVLRVTEFDPDRRFVVEGDLGPFKATLMYEFEDIGGATRLTNRADLEATGLAKLAAPIASGRVRDAVAENLRSLKRLLENGTVPDAIGR